MKNFEQMHKEILEKTQLKALYHRVYGTTIECEYTATLTIDNTTHEADEVVRRVLAFTDCLLEELRQDSIKYPTDEVTFTADGEALRLEGESLVGCAGEDRPRWEAFRERFARGQQLEMIYSYILESDVDWMLPHGLWPLLSEPLEGGRLAHCVKLSLIASDNDWADDLDTSSEPILRRCFWVNGMHQGRYVCGEVPCIRRDELLSSVTCWRQVALEPAGDEEPEAGLTLHLAPDTESATVDRVREVYERYAGLLDCRYLSSLSLEEVTAARRASSKHSPSAEEEQEMTAQLIRHWLDYFGQVRAAFTEEEARTLMSYRSALQDMFTRQAGDKYTPQEVELYRFGVAAEIILLTLQSPFRDRLSDELVRLIEKIPKRLLSPSRKPMFGHSEHFPALGDLPETESWAVWGMGCYGLYATLWDTRLRSLEDVERFEAMLDELAEISDALPFRSGRHDSGDQPVIKVDLDTCTNFDAFVGQNFVDSTEDGQTVSVKKDLDDARLLTNREALEALRRGELLPTCDTGCLVPGEVAFEAVDKGCLARLIFRRVNGHYEHTMQWLEA